NQAAGTSALDGSGHGVTGTVSGPTWVPGYGFPQDTSAPVAPTGLVATPDDGTASLTWTLNGESDVAGYDLYRSTDLPVSTSGTPLNGADLLTTRPYLDTGLTNGTQYHYAIVVVDGADNRSDASSTASTTPVPGDPVLVGAGDIADCDRTQDEATAALISGIPGGVFTLGDNVYDNGLASEFASCYASSWGAFKDRTRPTPGNHDYGNGSNDGSGYFDYFNDASMADRAGDPAEGYYSYDVGDWWHVVVLNSECYSYSVCDPAAQLQWLRADLNGHAGRNVMATMHKPRWTSGNNRPGITNLQPLWQELYEHGVEMLFVGHDHHYERFAPQNGAGGLDTSFGVREFIVGTGGESVGGLGTVAANSEVRDGATYGVMKLRLHQSSYDWQFIPIAGQTFTDSGSQAVHGVPSLRPVIDSVVISPTSPGTNTTLTSTVTSHDPNGDTVTLSRQWTRNGVDIPGATGSTLNLATAGNGDKGELIRLRVTGSDSGGAGAPTTSASVTVQNSAPTATVTLNNSTPGTNTVLTATATKADLDNDATTLTYVWKTNSATKKTTAGTASPTDTFDLSLAGNGDAGDIITVEVTPSDGSASGTMVSRTVTIDAAPAAPGAPVVTLSLTAVNLDWPNSSEADLAGYNVYRAASPGGSYTKLNPTLLTASTYADATAPAQATSYYRVHAVDTGGSESPPTAASAFRGIAFRAASSQKASGTSIAVPRPAGVAVNDVLLAVVQVRSAGVINTPAGWTSVRSDPNGTALRQAVFVHVAQALDPASFTWTFAGSQSATGVILAYAGVNPAAPLDGSSSHVASTVSIPTTSFSTTAPDAAVIGLFGTATNATIAPPATLIERAEIASSGKVKSVLEAADSLQAAAGSTGAPAGSAGAAAANIGQLVALRPANVPGPPDTVSPTTPSGLTATAVSANQVDLAWTASVDNVGVDHYVITRNGVQLAAAPTGTFFSDTTVVPNTAYTYTVAAVDAVPNVSQPSNTASVTPSSITFRGASSAAAKSASSLSLPRPSLTQVGNVLIASIDVRGAGAVTPQLAGWTLVQQETVGVLTKRTYWRVAGAEAGPYVFTFGSAQTAAGVIAAYAGVDTAAPIGDHSGGTGTTTSITAPSVTVSSVGSRIVSLVGVATNGSITAPSGWTERAEIVGGSGSSRVASELSDAAAAVVGPTGSQTATSSKAAAGVAQLLVLRPTP
ncbi:MAG: metallophosphoesterase, partial [Acidimicrobiales bacterium]